MTSESFWGCAPSIRFDANNDRYVLHLERICLRNDPRGKPGTVVFDDVEPLLDQNSVSQLLTQLLVLEKAQA